MNIQDLPAFWPMVVTLVGLASGFGANRLLVHQLTAKIEMLNSSIAALQSSLASLGTRSAVNEERLVAHDATDRLRFKAIETRLDIVDRHIESMSQHCMRCLNSRARSTVSREEDPRD